MNKTLVPPAFCFMPAVIVLLLAVIVVWSPAVIAQSSPASYKVENNIPYYEGEAARKADDYQKSQCQLDLYYPENHPGYATVIWLHGGGLTGGKRGFANLKNRELGLVSVSYRLSPKAESPAFLEDAAAATAWVFRHIAERGGDPKKIFIAGHSAGGYLAAMVGMDPRWLSVHGLSHRQLAGIIPVSAQVTTHFLVKKVRGDTRPEFRPIIDEYAPLYYASKTLSPICLILGDRSIEYKNRVEENDFLAVSLRNLGHPAVEFYEMGGLNHGTVTSGAWILMPQFIARTLSNPAP